MTDAILFNSATPRFTFPMLYSAQAQKELCVNESLAILDAALHCNIEGTSATPPTAPINGSNWLVAASATGAWTGQDNNIACYQNGNWIFLMPKLGMNVFDHSLQQYRHFGGVWQNATTPSIPTGGTVVDTQARTAIANLISALTEAGLFAGT